MSKLRRILGWVTLVGIAALIGLSVVGAFLGPNTAAEFFNSVPLAAYWVALLSLLVLGVILFRSMIRCPGLLAMHLGCILILGGAMWGSQAGHVIAGRLSGHHKVSKGYMRIDQGQSENAIIDDLTLQEQGILPFHLKLDRFWIEYYPARWTIHGGMAVSAQGGAGKRWETREIDWRIGKEVTIPFTNVRMRVLQYLPAARACLRIVTPGGKEYLVPIAVDQDVYLAGPKVRLKITKVFKNFKEVVRDSQRKAVDALGPGMGPAVAVRLDYEDGRTVIEHVLLRRARPRENPPDKIAIKYIIMPNWRPDDDSARPAAELELTMGSTQHRRWVFAMPNTNLEWMPLASVFAKLADAKNLPSLFLVKLRPEIRDYKSRLVVIEDGREVFRKVIEVNDPLHYGGYHFYQYSYDEQHQKYTVLRVMSDSGLTAFYTGLFGLCAGAVWRLWLRPVWKDLRKAKS